MANSRPMHRRIALIWNIATCAVIVGVVLFIALRTASPAAFVIVGVVLIVLAFLVRRYRSVAVAGAGAGAGAGGGAGASTVQEQSGQGPGRSYGG